MRYIEIHLKTNVPDPKTGAIYWYVASGDSKESMVDTCTIELIDKEGVHYPVPHEVPEEVFDIVIDFFFN